LELEIKQEDDMNELSGYILALLEKYGMKNCNRIAMPSEIPSHRSTTKPLDQISNSGE